MKRSYAAVTQDPDFVPYKASKSYVSRRKPRLKSVRASNKLATKADIARAISASEEIKVSNYYLQNSQISSYGTTAGGLSLPLTPAPSIIDIQQGSGQGARVGNRIKTKRVKLSLTFVPNSYNATSNPTPIPQMIVGYIYYDTQNSTVVSAPDSTFVQLGSSSEALRGRVLDAISEVNTDRWKLFKKFTLKVGFATNTGTGASANNANFANNGFEMEQSRTFDVTKYCPKYITYNDTSGITTSRNCLLYLQSIPYNGGVNPAAGIPTQVNVAIEYKYSDA